MTESIQYAAPIIIDTNLLTHFNITANNLVTIREVPAEEISNNLQKSKLWGVTAYWWPCMNGKSVNGQNRYWQIGFNIDDSSIYTISGTVGGNPPTPKRKAVKAMGNRNIVQQAILNINSKITKRQREDGFLMYDENNSPFHITSRNDPFAVSGAHPDFMLADEYAPNLVSWPWIGQEKMDGIRAMGYVQNDPGVGWIGKLRSRSNKNYTFLDHIFGILPHIFNYLPIGTYLDGELYSHTLTFNQISSVVKRTKNPHPDRFQMQYHVFDIIFPTGSAEAQLGYVARMNILSNVIAKLANDYPNLTKIIVIMQYQLINSEAELLAFHRDATLRGFEGVIIRNPNSVYVQKRCKEILKYKQFFEEETTIISVYSAEGNEAGLAMLKVRDRDGKELIVRPRGTFEMRKQWLEHPELIIGRCDYTIIHFGKSVEHDNQRFAVGKGFRDVHY